MDFSQFAIVGLIGVIYFFTRIVGKYAGAYLGCKMVKTDKATAVNLGFALVPQAGVAIGLAVLGQRMLVASGNADLGNEFFAIIICSSVLYEMVGPALAKLALVKSGAIPQENLKAGHAVSYDPVEPPHESRRIDNQLRGRSGRQGDPGFSRFYVCFDDDLMRRFAPDNLRKMFVTQLQDSPLENKTLVNAVTNAQKQIEGQNFDIRKNLLDYDDVLAKQRQIIYDHRDKIMKIIA